ncbi:hypothetical protein ACFWUZ_31885 [Streptomyces sp. NPDC058646]|uniref:hypothetical protein n=1 Tax=Streptomyces sp. NPDC058646 TaxID=3346574 RepID=UPI003663F67C
MIRMIRTKNLRTLQEGAALASVLEEQLEEAEGAVEAFRGDLDTQDEKNRDLEEELGGVRTELAAAETRNHDLIRLTGLLFRALDYAGEKAEAPLDVVLHKGRVEGIYRDRAAAMASTPFADRGWGPVPDPAPEPLGWMIERATPPRLAAPPNAQEIEDLLERVERPDAERLAEAERIQELTGALETVRAQRGTAMKDTDTAATALTAESLAFALHRAAVAEVAAKIAHALSASDPVGSIVDVGALLLRYADVLCIDPHGPGLAGEASTETKGAAA